MKYLKFLAALLFLSCNNSSNKSLNLVDITSKTEQGSGFVDLVLNITDKSETDSTVIFTTNGLYKNDTVGIRVSLKKGITKGIVNGEMKNVFIKNGVALKSIGAKSDKLLNAFSELYNLPEKNLVMRNDLVVLTCANLNEHDVDFQNGNYKFKVFMEDGEDNAELYINFDFTNKQIQLNEKDNEYRKAIVKYLTKK